MPSPMQQLLNTLPQRGVVTWIGVRPARRAPVEPVEAVFAQVGSGLIGDRFQGKPESTRQVTLIQGEHLRAVASFLGMPEVEPGLLRRNLVVEGINLLALKDKRFRIGVAVLEMTGLCHPCSRMEETLGPGGYNALRGHGGITARVLQEGQIRLGDPVWVLEPEKPTPSTTKAIG
jgi:MOSC domain-containing protein YiiM